MIPKLASKYTCTGCMACIDSCPTRALFSKMGKDGHLYVDCDDSACIACTKCEKTCPIVSGFSYENKEEYRSQPYAAWADDEIRKNSASGGVFAAIAYTIIAEGGYVVGAIMDGFEVKHIISNNQEDIAKMQGSKYLHGNMSNIYREVKAKLKEGEKVFFCGLGCQVGGLLSFLNGRYTENLLTADLICSGVPSSLLLDKFLEKNDNGRFSGIKSFRDKRTPWKGSGGKLNLRLISKSNEVVDFGGSNILSRGFSSHITSRYSCFGCEFIGCSRKSDITLADFWGLKEYIKYQDNGISVIITHSDKGLYYLEKSELILKKAKWKDFLPYNPRMCVAKSLPKFDPFRMNIGFFFKYCTYSNLTKLYASNINSKDFFWLPYKIYRYSLFRFFKYKTDKVIKETLKKYD